MPSAPIRSSIGTTASNQPQQPWQRRSTRQDRVQRSKSRRMILVQETSTGIPAQSGSYKQQPWAINVSFIAPHFPLDGTREDTGNPTHWTRWTCQPNSRRPSRQSAPGLPAPIRSMFGLVEFPEEDVRRARAGYYALISYFDEKIGQLIDSTGGNRASLKTRSLST